THSRQWLTVFRNEDSETHNPISLNRIESGTARTSVDETHPVPTEGRAFFDVFEDADDTWHDTFFRCLEEKRRQNGYERRLSRIDGPTYWVDWEIRPWQTKTGEQRGLLLSVVDRSEEREAKRLRRQVDRRFDALLDTIGEGVLLM
ncbi:MAG: PAS domain S-box protein, partial [Salinibacter sp.]